MAVALAKEQTSRCHLCPAINPAERTSLHRPGKREGSGMKGGALKCGHTGVAGSSSAPGAQTAGKYWPKRLEEGRDYLLSVYHTPGLLLSTLQTLSYWIIKAAQLQNQRCSEVLHRWGNWSWWSFCNLPQTTQSKIWTLVCKFKPVLFPWQHEISASHGHSLVQRKENKAPKTNE